MSTVLPRQGRTNPFAIVCHQNKISRAATIPTDFMAAPSMSRQQSCTVRPTMTHCSLQSESGDFLTREAAERECELKHKWLASKRLQETREAEYRAAVAARLRRGEVAQAESEQSTLGGEEFDPDLVDWDEDDPGNPQNLPFRRKVWITGLCCLLTINVTFASSAPSSAVMQIAEIFGVSQEASVLITSIFLCGYIAGPIVWAPISELVGRRPVFVGTLLIYTLFQLGQALGKNFVTVIATRFLAGLFASAPLTNCGGVIADIWDPVRRGAAMSLFTGSVFLGPLLGPIVGGFIVDSHLGWRWVFWIMIIFAATCWIVIAIFFPETYGPCLLQKRARYLRKQDPEKYGNKYAAVERLDFSPRALLSRTVLRPFLMLVQEPILVLITIYLSIIYGLLYALFSVFPIIWQQLRGFNAGEGGLIFIGVGLGTSIGAAINIYTQRHYVVLVPKWHGSPPAEERLPGAMLAGPFLIIGIFWLGWTGAFPHIPWYVPALATIPIGTSFTLIFISYLTYIVDTYLLFSASALAANTICRSAVGAAFPLFTRQMFDGLGVQWACTLIGCVAIVMLPVPFVFYKYGSTIRERSRFAPCIDLKIKDQVEQEERELQEKEKGRERDFMQGDGAAV